MLDDYDYSYVLVSISGSIILYLVIDMVRQRYKVTRDLNKCANPRIVVATNANGHVMPNCFTRDL